MKPLEIITTLVAFVAAAALAFPESTGTDAVAPMLVLAGVALAAVDLTVKPFRWQMIPVYVVILAVVAILVLGLRPEGVVRYVAAGLASAACALTVALAAGFPLRALPGPDGPFGVGAVRTELTRPGGGTGGTGGTGGGARKLLVKIWYPTGADEPPSARSPEPLWSEYYSVAGMPAMLRLLTGYLRGVETHTVREAPIRADSGSYPVLVYNHALVSIPSENTLLMESLASHGYIVASIAHVDQMAEHVHLQRGLPAAERARDKALFAELRSAPSRAERARIMAEIYRQSTGMSTLVRNRAEDSVFVLDRIETVLAAIPGYADAPSADLERVGALGFSLGGAVATLWCQTDTRCRAAANIDGGLFGVRLDEPSPVPYLMIYAERSLGSNDVFKASSGATFEEVVAVGATHLDLTDATVIGPLLKRLGVLGRTPGSEIVRFKNERIRAFFDAHLKATEVFGGGTSSIVGSACVSGGRQPRGQSRGVRPAG